MPNNGPQSSFKKSIPTWLHVVISIVLSACLAMFLAILLGRIAAAPFFHPYLGPYGGNGLGIIFTLLIMSFFACILFVIILLMNRKNKWFLLLGIYALWCLAFAILIFSGFFYMVGSGGVG